MGDHDDRKIICAQIIEQRKNRLGGDRIEVAGWLVCQEHRWLGHQGPSNCYPLAFTARESRGQEVQPMAEPHALKRQRGAIASAASREPTGGGAVDLGQHHVLDHAAMRQQMKALKHESNPLAPHRSELSIGQIGHVDSVEEVRALGGEIKQTEHVEQRRLS